MKRMVTGLLAITLYGCASDSDPTTPLTESPSCAGSPAIPAEFSASFKATQNPALLAEALGEPLQGKLCQGQVYQVTSDLTIYRAWNSTNPNSQFGQWWALELPAGSREQYRKDYEICYQWSPLDKLSKCTLKAGSTVVIGNGQSAQCSEYLTYPASEKHQIYLPDAANSVENCELFDGVMSWE